MHLTGSFPLERKTTGYVKNIIIVHSFSLVCKETEEVLTCNQSLSSQELLSIHSLHKTQIPLHSVYLLYKE